MKFSIRHILIWALPFFMIPSCSIDDEAVSSLRFLNKENIRQFVINSNFIARGKTIEGDDSMFFVFGEIDFSKFLILKKDSTVFFYSSDKDFVRFNSGDDRVCIAKYHDYFDPFFGGSWYLNSINPDLLKKNSSRINDSIVKVIVNTSKTHCPENTFLMVNVPNNEILSYNDCMYSYSYSNFVHEEFLYHYPKVVTLTERNETIKFILDDLDLHPKELPIEFDSYRIPDND